MHLKNLSVFQFKNHKERYFEFEEKINGFIGDNGIGKTNLLDAIHYLCLSKSCFNYIDSQNILFGEDFFMLKGIFDKNNKEEEIQCNVHQANGKILKKEGKKYKRFSEHIGKYPLIIISPADTNLILEGSEVRRKYIDSTISQYNKQYLKDLIDYNKVLKQRNSLLKKFAITNTFDDITLEIFDFKLIEYGNKIYKERSSFIEKLIPIFTKYYQFISNDKEIVKIKYKSQLNESDFEKQLVNAKNTDRKIQSTSVGIHRDDLIFMMNNHPIKKIGSQGQQKSFLIAIRLAQFDFMQKELGLKPILILDDIFDKLDDKRVLQLINLVDNGLFEQVFFSDTNLQRCEDILKRTSITYKLFNIEKQ